MTENAKLSQHWAQQPTSDIYLVCWNTGSSQGLLWVTEMLM